MVFRYEQDQILRIQELDDRPKNVDQGRLKLFPHVCLPAFGFYYRCRTVNRKKYFEAHCTTPVSSHYLVKEQKIK